MSALSQVSLKSVEVAKKIAEYLSTICLQDTANVDLSDNLKKLIASATHELWKTLQQYEDEGTTFYSAAASFNAYLQRIFLLTAAHKRQIIDEFLTSGYILSELSKYPYLVRTRTKTLITTQLIRDQFSQNEATYDVRNEKLEELSNKLFIASLEKHLSSLNEVYTALEEDQNFLQRFLIRTSLKKLVRAFLYWSLVVFNFRETQKYELAYAKESQTSSDDLLDLTTLQTNVLKLQADIHHANEQQVEYFHSAGCSMKHQKKKGCFKQKYLHATIVP